MTAVRTRRVVVAGTAFGRVYLDAIDARPRHYTLAGIISRGGDFSRALARRRGVPLYHGPSEVPDDVDLACVVVRSAVTGGAGSELAAALLRKGIAVVQEHPVHTDEIAANLRLARTHGTAYTVNTMYPHLRPVRRFLAATARLRQRHPLRFIDAATNSQVLYPLLDILGRAAGGLRPWRFDAPAPRVHDGPHPPFTSLEAVLGGVPASLRVQNEVHPDDPDNHSYLFHRIAVGTDAGVLTLADTHGPVLWQPRLHAPRDGTGRLHTAGPGTERLAVASTLRLGADAGTFHDAFADLWPDAVATGIDGLRDTVDRPHTRAAAGQWALAVSRAWADLTALLGLPDVIRPPEPESYPAADLVAAADGADHPTEAR